MTQTNDTLAQFRAQIDAIDEEMIALLRKRVEIVHRVGKLKASQGSVLSFIRPGREATMLRELSKKGEGVLPKEAIATIWRMIISSSLCIEQAMNIAVFAPEKQDYCYWLCREYYGTFVETKRYEHTDDVIDAVACKKAAVGILPLEVSEHVTPWWVRPEGEKNDIYIFARIPFVRQKNQPFPSALAIANVMPEPTEDDVSVLAVRALISVEELTAVFAASGLGCRVIVAQSGDYLLEAACFLQPMDERLAKVRKLLGPVSSVRLLGAYAVPMTME
jgi:chorismate mutase-like protein